MVYPVLVAFGDESLMFGFLWWVLKPLFIQLPHNTKEKYTKVW